MRGLFVKFDTLPPLWYTSKAVFVGSLGFALKKSGVILREFLKSPFVNKTIEEGC
jgi:hypothetical protein